MTPSIPIPDLQRRLKASIGGFCSSTIRPTVDVDKIVWNARIRRNELYYRGQQSLIYTMNNGVVDYVPLAQGQNMGVGINNTNNVDNIYDYVQNFFQGDVDTFVSVLGSRAPNCQAQARDLQNEKQVRLKMKADRCASFLSSHWNVPLLHSQLVRGLALYGTMFSHTRFTANSAKYGTTPITSYEVQNMPMGNAYYQCYNCGAETPADQAHALAAQQPGYPGDAACSQCTCPLGPESLVQPEMMPTLVEGITTQYPNGSVEMSIRNPACITTKISVSDLDKAPWLIEETEEDKGALLQAYPELRPKAYEESYSLGADIGGVLGRWTRELITSPTGYMLPKMKATWLHTQIWIARSTYEYMPNDRDGALRDYLSQTYPDGFKVPMVNGEVLIGDPNPTKDNPQGKPNRMMNERLTSVWAACKPKPSEMIYADPYFDCMIQMQDTINDCLSMLIEQAERSNSFVIADPEILSPDTIRNLSGAPGEFKWAKPGSGGALDRAFFRVPAAELNPVLINLIDKAISWCREITGIVPALFGGGDNGPEQTAYEANLKHNQALMKLNTPWKNLRQFWAKTFENGIYQAAKYSNGHLYTSNQHGQVDQLDMDGLWELADGGWYMQCEESMPQTIGERKAWIMNVYTMPPEVQEEIGMNEPDNIIKRQEAIGMSDWTMPGYSTVIKLHQNINQLMQAQPIPGPPGPPDPVTGMPGPPGPDQPSIPYDQNLFDPQLAIKVVRSWLLSDNASQKEGTPGYANVQAYFQAIQEAMPPNSQPPKPYTFAVTANMADLTPPAQEAIFQSEGINIAPGTLIANPPQPKGIAAPPHGGPPAPPQASNSLLTPPPGAIGPPPPGGLQ